MSKLVEEQLKKVERADLSQFDAKTNSYFIPKLKEIKIEQNCSYLIKVNDSVYFNETLRMNWNAGKCPDAKWPYLVVEVGKIMAKMILVNSIGFNVKDVPNHVDASYIWNGWLPINEIQIIQKL